MSSPHTGESKCVNTGNFGVTVTFANCWNGNNFSTAPRGANVIHDDGGTICPDTHFKELPQLNMALDYIIWQSTTTGTFVKGRIMVNDGNGKVNPPPGTHADYFNSEDQSELTERCINLDETGDFCRH